MAWLSSCSSTNKIDLAKQDFREGPFFWIEGTTGIGGVADLKFAYRRRTVESYEYVGVTLAAADSFIGDNPSTTTYSAANHKTTNFTSRRERMNEASGYKVVCETETIWDIGYG